jgi:hypothetical protein
MLRSKTLRGFLIRVMRPVLHDVDDIGLHGGGKAVADDEEGFLKEYGDLSAPRLLAEITKDKVVRLPEKASR